MCAVVVVGVKPDCRSKELLTWALVKVANSGDRVIALCIIHPHSVRKILSREAASCGATSLVLGTSKANTTLRSKTSLAKSCAKTLQNNISVICVDNGWMLLRRTFLHGSRGFEYASSKKSSVMHWLSKLPSWQSVAAIYPDQKQFSASDKIFSDELVNLQETYSNKCQLFSYQELSLATNNFIPGCPVSGDQFSWGKRYKIALGVAEALDALHNAAEPIIHRDVKSSNILLSDDFVAQLSDFGLATWKSRCSHDMDTSDVVGTFGYLAPECFMHGELNEKIDVYAFGVVLLELLSGKKAIDNGLPRKLSCVGLAKHILKEGKISELQDPSLADAYDRNQFESVVLAATLCIRQSRPAISLVLKLLQGDLDVIEWARQEASHIDYVNDEESATDIQSFISLALLDLEDETAFKSVVEQNVSVEED
ncbi:hypothetical protein SASPL_105202 [Salvia splendens]|uniref:Protein kinase domain-containing protein n=1 Tax=Salvia splendens TaxID=180675 RepID=A0A8X9A940_SALSN|nr:hypothetical protein SASPL_105202 [Salvia splendens]